MKAYFAYTNKLYKVILVLILIVAAAMLSALTWTSFHAQTLTFVFPALFSAIIIFAEVWLDHYMFGPCCRKDDFSMELLRSSVRGQTLFRQIVLTDMVRHLLWTVLTFLTITITCGGGASVTGYALLTAASLRMGVMLGVFLVRKTEYQVTTILVIYAAVAVTAFVSSIFGGMWAAQQDRLFSQYRYSLLPGLGCIVVMLLLMILTARATLKRRKDSYYDAE